MDSTEQFTQVHSRWPRSSEDTAYLFHAGGHDDPARLKANENLSFQGSIVLGMGFTFDDTDHNGVANPLAVMDRAVLDGCGWTDIQPTCEFLLDYVHEDEEEDEGRGRGRGKPWRYRWPDDIRDEVLARLLKLNAQWAAEERRTGAAAAEKKKAKRRRRKRRSATNPLRTRRNWD